MSDRRPTKAERREDARLRREELQLKIARKKRNRRVFGVLGVLALVAAVILIGIVTGSDLPSPDSLLADAPDATQTAGCGAVTQTDPFDIKNITGELGDATPEGIDRDHIGTTYDPTMPAFDKYPSIPPASGPHAGIPTPGPLPAGVYDTAPPMDRVIHSLEHGATVVWYSPQATGQELELIKDFYGQRLIDEDVGQGRVIVAPYDYPDQGKAGHLPGGAQMALVVWHNVQTCGQLSFPVAYLFTSTYTDATAPESGGAF